MRTTTSQFIFILQVLNDCDILIIHVLNVLVKEAFHPLSFVIDFFLKVIGKHRSRGARQTLVKCTY